MTRFKRQFVDVAHGQMHVRTAGDPAAPALVMLHAGPHTGATLMPLAAHLAARRRVVLIDTAGNGDSETLPAERVEVADLAATHWQVVDALGLERIDLYGAHTGASICIELAIAHGERIGGIVMDGFSAFTPDEVARLFAHSHAPAIVPDLEGTQFTKCFAMVRDEWLFWPWWDRRDAARRRLDLPSSEKLHAEVVEFLKGCTTYQKNYNAGIRYRKAERAHLVRNPVLITASPSDMFHPHLDRVGGMIAGARIQATPEREADGGSQAAAVMLDFLDQTASSCRASGACA